ncbi:hypothetical protein LV716_09445 [Flagellimonas sp. HMM57]|uniref:hypothetical protein n=1 Tax=unclassified Flagellimonas TaxID=2644544 RepID=UPI0013D74B00|nr:MULTISPECIES: hypothetical protein [unclassified Flagellimonas]UII74490.1 hypothetical protein LV716_09445 [Flagellimonas sp. HMM57]
MTFETTLNNYFPGSISLEDYIHQTHEKLTPLGFTNENTFACVSVCRDEITKPLLDQTDLVWGEVFNFSSLAGSLTLGKTGFAAAASHAPIIDGLERYIFIAMPHIAISEKGEIGIVYREGRSGASHACGALEAIIDEIGNGKLHLQLDMDDIEQSILKTKIFEKLQYGEKPDLVRITKIAHEIIVEDLERLIQVAEKEPYDYAVLTGIMIHGPEESNYVYPQSFYAVTMDNREEKKSLVL